jgi:PhnB protein
MNEARLMISGGVQMAKVKAIPEGHNSVSPYLVVNGAARALDFYKNAFGAKELMRFDAPGGKVGHAEVRIGDTVVMLADEHPDHDAHAPGKFGGSPVGLHLYVEDVDKVWSQALGSGAKVKRPLENQFYGDRAGALEDPFGHTWHLSSHVEDVSPAELDRRMQAMMKDGKK